MKVVFQQKNEKSYYFIDEQFNPINRFKYKETSEFRNGFAAIKDARGWTIINEKSIPVTYPSFGEIKQVGNHLFVTSKQKEYTLFKSDGTMVIPPMNKLSILNNSFIQCIKNGEISYYRVNGKLLF